MEPSIVSILFLHPVQLYLNGIYYSVLVSVSLFSCYFSKKKNEPNGKCILGTSKFNVKQR